MMQMRVNSRLAHRLGASTDPRRRANKKSSAMFLREPPVGQVATLELNRQRCEQTTIKLLQEKQTNTTSENKSTTNYANRRFIMQQANHKATSITTYATSSSETSTKPGTKMPKMCPKQKMMPKLSFPIILLNLLVLASTLYIAVQAKLNSVLDINGTFPYLINKTTGEIIEPRDYMNFDNLYAPNETYQSQVTAQSRNYHLVKAFDFANYYQSDYWHYSNELELKLSGQPVANSSRCAEQLDWLEARLNDSAGRVLFERGQQHVNLMTLVDSFGRPEASTFMGHAYWLGSYHECIRSLVDMGQFEREQRCPGCATTSTADTSSTTGSFERSALESEGSNLLKTRYCVGKVRDKEWPSSQEDDYQPVVTYKVGLCLPESCETLSIGRHRAQIERIMLFQFAEFQRHRYTLHDMYCLPDPRSPLRLLSPAAKVYLSACAVWLTLLVCATLLYACYRRHQADLRAIVHHRKSVSVMQADLIVNYKVAPMAQQHTSPDSVDIPLANDEDCHLSLGPSEQHERHEGLKEPSKRSSSSASLALWLQESPLFIKCLQALSISENLKEFRLAPAMLRQKGSDERLRINFNALDAIKCLCCVLVIFGHVIFVHMQHLSNIMHTIELSYEVYPRFLIAFFNFVDTFFIISGMLTAYFVFKRFDLATLGKPIVWFQVSLLRLLRLSPVYLLVFWFVKTTSVYLADGPIWDYGTDRNSIKGLCINDHWWKSLLYLGNWGTMQPLCILPAWSIIVDAQYSLLLPPALWLVARHRRLGQTLLVALVVLSTANMSLQLATQSAVRTSDMAKIRLHVYPLISRFAAEFYNAAWNRIGPLAIGILGGRALYLYDKRQIRRWPWFMRGTPFKIMLLMHLFIFVLPTIGRYTDDPKQSASADTDMTIFILSNATIKPIWSLINTILLLRLITDLRSHSLLAKLMSHNIWHCLGKLCFVSYLIHYEIILILLKSRPEGLLDPNWPNAMREFCLAFVISTAISYVVYILFEAPINKLITLLILRRPRGTGHHKQTRGEQPLDAGSPLASAPLAGLLTIHPSNQGNKAISSLHKVQAPVLEI